MGLSLRAARIPEDGLVHPRDLAAWQAWQDRRNAARILKARARAQLREGIARLRSARTVLPGRGRTQAGAAAGPPEAAETGLVLLFRGARPFLLAAVETAGPTQAAAVLRPLEHLDGEDLAVLVPAAAAEAVSALLPGTGWRSVPLHRSGARLPVDGQSRRSRRGGQAEHAAAALAEAGCLDGVREVLGVGHYLPAGAAAFAWARRRGLRTWVVQHGLLTPQAPPLPEDTRLFAFSAADAAFWTSGRTDVTTCPVGSQLLWEAGTGSEPATGLDPATGPEPTAEGSLPVDPHAAPVWLGQLHGAEAGRLGMALTAYRFCRAHGAVYRPHPGEKDVLSRAVHRLWVRLGVAVDTDPVPLARLRAPVVSAFSTGVLEAAALGLPAWVHHEHPPAWMRRFWDRYGMSPWDPGKTTPRSTGPAAGPAPVSRPAPASPPTFTSRPTLTSPPTPAPPRPVQEPAAAIAQALRGAGAADETMPAATFSRKGEPG